MSCLVEEGFVNTRVGRRDDAHADTFREINIIQSTLPSLPNKIMNFPSIFLLLVQCILSFYLLDDNQQLDASLKVNEIKTEIFQFQDINRNEEFHNDIKHSTNDIKHSTNDIKHSIGTRFDDHDKKTEASGGKTEAKKAFEQVSRIHGILMWISWVIIPFIAIFCARYLKCYLGSYWFSLHWFLFGIVSLTLTTVGFFIIYVKMKSPHFSGHSLLKDSHVKLGLIVPLMMIFQICLGLLAHYYFDPTRSKVTTVDKVHWWIGRLVVLLGIINVTLGGYLFKFKKFTYDTFIDVEVLHWTVIGVGILAFVLAEMYIGRKHHVKLDENSKKVDE